jgi:alpha-D-xyloside xylohydrolase
MDKNKGRRSVAITRRGLLGSGAGAAFVSSGLVQAAARIASPDFVIRSGDLSIAVTALSDRAFRVRIAPVGAPPATPGEMLAPIAKPPVLRRIREGNRTRLTLPQAQCVWDGATGCLSFHDGAGNLLLSESPGSRHVAQSTIGNEPTLAVAQGFASPADERLFGTGCFQDA